MMVNLQELQTVVHHRLPIKLIIVNNDDYLMIKHTQDNLFAGRHVAVDRATGVSRPDFSALATADLAQQVADMVSPGKPVRIVLKREDDAGRLRYVPSIERARKELGPGIETALPEAIRRTARWHSR